MDCSLPGSSVHGILQARVLEWVAIPFSRVSSHPRDWTRVSHTAGRFFTIWATREREVAQLCLTLWDPMAMGFSRQEYWSGLPFPSLEDLPNTGIEPRSPALQADSLLSESPGKPKAQWGVGLNCCCYFLSQIQTRRLPTAFQSITITNMTTRKIPVCPCRARSSDLVNRSRADEEGLRTGRSPKANLKSEWSKPCDSWSTLANEYLLFCLLLLLLLLLLCLPLLPWKEASGRQKALRKEPGKREKIIAHSK